MNVLGEDVQSKVLEVYIFSKVFTFLTFFLVFTNKGSYRMLGSVAFL